MDNKTRTMKISINDNKDVFINSARLDVIPGRKYKASTQARITKGNPYCAYFAVFLLSSDGTEVARHIRWLNDISSNMKEYKIVFTADPKAANAVIGYRMNIETPIKGDIKMECIDIGSIELRQAVPDDNEDFDDINKFIAPYIHSLTPKQEDIIERKMLWILGNMRSGTTWLTNELLNHPDNLIWLEPKIMDHMALLKYEYYKDNKNYFFTNQQRNNWIPSMRSMILKRAYSQFNDFSKNIIIKEVLRSGADLIMQCLPKSKICFLLRDGRDCVESLLDIRRGSSWLKDDWEIRATRTELIRWASHGWNNSTNNISKAYKNHDEKRRILLKYEDLRDNTVSELMKLYELLNIKISDKEIINIAEKYSFNNVPDSQKGPGKFKRAATTGGWRKTFSKEEIDLMNSIMGDTLQQFGYEA